MASVTVAHGEMIGSGPGGRQRYNDWGGIMSLGLAGKKPVTAADSSAWRAESVPFGCLHERGTPS